MFDNEKFQNKYRIKSNRANWWDYGNNGAYFITICTKNRECYFWDWNGCCNYDCDCRDAINCVSTPLPITAMGKIANDIWFEIPKQFNYLELGEFVVMPNHIHGIIIINKKDDCNCRDAIKCVSTNDNVSTKSAIGGFAGNKNPLLNKNLSHVVKWYKGRVSYEIHKNNKDFAWQNNYHDRIILNYIEYQHIVDYIINNPKNWETDINFLDWV